MEVEHAKQESPQLVRATDDREESFEALFREHYDLIFNLSYRLCSNAHDAEDLAQESFVKAARSIGNFRGDASFKSWIYRITLNTAWDFKRKKKRKDDLHRQYVEEKEIINCGSGHSHSDIIIAALDLLSTRQRKAIVLTYFEGFNHAEAAAIIGCAETTVSWHVFAAKKKLKPYLIQNGLSS